MSRFKKSQLLMLSLLLALLFITPLLSSSIRPTYLYFIFNLLIISLGAEAGFLSFFSKPQNDIRNYTISTSFVSKEPSSMTMQTQDDKKNYVNTISFISRKPSLITMKTQESASPEETNNNKVAPPTYSIEEKKTVVVEKSTSEKLVVLVPGKVDDKVEKCKSSLFFIGSGEAEEEETEEECEEEEKEEEEVSGISGQELFAKAETFIGNFYKQLKMQREESWNSIHGLYHKAF